MADTQFLNSSQQSSNQRTAALPPLPPDALIIVPVRGFVLFPGLVLPISVGRPQSMAAAQQAVRD
ncbi:MAG: LON peptidase substrate-binding domain-containing protein, partial [Xanthobacteraceae bacterium]